MVKLIQGNWSEDEKRRFIKSTHEIRPVNMTAWVEALELKRVDPYLILCPDVDSSLRLLHKFPDLIQPTMDLILSLLKL